ncbi:MAG TPA: two-component sensor histidine kinase [Desulfobulbaceae bacterium]|nr:two-component sensor histidine kinase [Desulfobulbaceae bacterium]
MIYNEHMSGSNQKNTPNDTEVKPGRLKIFLGMCAGVGKTYAMLQEARRELGAGRDPVVALVETHGRKETNALLEGLPQIPRRKVKYRDITLEELDLDAVLERKPQLAIVDEAAHTNAPDSRHPKRYQDIEELLAAGISVYTTLNVQHLESRSDVVRQVTSITVHETVPDSLLEEADEIQVVDITPEDLQERLAEHKVYLGQMAEIAAANFFRTENLTALREMTLRVAAEHTDRTLRDEMRVRGIDGPWKAGERLMVCIGPSQYYEGLIRWTRRVAGALDCSWIAAYVETDLPIGKADTESLTANLSLARQLGAEVIISAGHNVAQTLLRVARENNVSQIVIGKTIEPWWHSMMHGGSLANQLIRQSGLIDVYVVQPEKGQPARRTPGRAGISGNPKSWLAASTITAIITVLFLAIAKTIGYAAIGPLYLLWIVIAGLKFPRSIVLTMAACSALLWNFLFIPPKYTLYIRNFHDITMFLMFFVVALAIGQLTAKLKAKELYEQKRERRTRALYDLAEKVALAPELKDGLETGARMVEDLLNSKIALTLRLSDRTLSPKPHPAGTLELNLKEQSVAAWVFSKGLPAGRFTDTLTDAAALHLPLLARTGIYGVLSVQPNGDKSFDISERDLLEALAGLIAAILEKDHFIQAFSRAEVIEASEHLRKALFDSVPHELKTPLAALKTGFETLLLRMKTVKADEQEAVEEIRHSLKRMEVVINNLLDMTRIQAGVVKTKLEWADIEDIIAGAVELAGDALAGHKIVTRVSEGISAVMIDQGLIEQSVCNLLINAAVWSPPKSEIAIQANLMNGTLEIAVSDQGPGIPEHDLGKVFDKFYRASNAPTGGTGLGLSIVEGFINAHGGTVEARNRPQGGAEFAINLPIAEQHMGTQELPS